MREDIFAIDLENVVQEVYPKLENVEVTPTLKEQTIKPKEYGFSEVFVKAIETEDLNIKPKTEQQTFEGIYKNVNVDKINLQEKTITPTKEMQVVECENGFDGLNKVNIEGIQAQELNIIPSKEKQIFEGMYDKVNVEATTEIESETLNIIPTQEKQSYTGLFDQVNVDAIQTEEITIGLNFSTQDKVEVTASEGKYIKKAIINKDTNLVEENILEGKTVFGIRGTGKSGIDTSDATATAGDILKDKTAYVNGEKVTGTMEASNNNSTIETVLVSGGNSGGFNNIGTLITKLPDNITYSGTNALNMFRGCKLLEEIPLFNTSTITNMTAMFYECWNLKEIPLINTSNVANMANMFYDCRGMTSIPKLVTSKATNMASMFYNCLYLESVPVLDTSSVTSMQNMFKYCTRLSDESLNNILQMCINAKKITSSSTKTLSYIGLTSDQATRCQSLSNYQAFLDAGLVTGY